MLHFSVRHSTGIMPTVLNCHFFTNELFYAWQNIFFCDFSARHLTEKPPTVLNCNFLKLIILRMAKHFCSYFSAFLCFSDFARIFAMKVLS
jgi:hypothetical protein